MNTLPHASATAHASTATRANAHSATHPRAKMTLHIGTGSDGHCSGFIHPNRFSNLSGDTGDNLNACRTEGLKGIGAAITYLYDGNPLVGQQLSGLDSRAVAQGDVGILNRLKLQSVRIDDQKICASSETSVDGVIQRLS